jgi:hypothetical protein
VEPQLRVEADSKFCKCERQTGLLTHAVLRPGAESTFIDLYEREYPHVWRYCRRRLPAADVDAVVAILGQPQHIVAPIQ